MTFTVLPFAPKGAAVRPAACPKPVLRATWSLDPETGRPVCHWSAGETDAPTRCPIPRRQAA
ncbi:hypothetical protein FF100_32255 [Methylobacterium terricola]|uniref:Uncharacterized protein n=1 Tax=Methylobacterium terricola TaxID=2583531 RepID=A0A5C4L6T4_9HYPH|nr:hypothetical protein [Methylobacterium terricola]TNC07500.1 hypothetical protein FF100_32255 [Methylobacterium terricola]